MTRILQIADAIFSPICLIIVAGAGLAMCYALGQLMRL